MANRDEIVRYANELLETAKWPEFGPPGLQVIGAEEVTTLVCGVSVSRDLFDDAVGRGAEMVLVHHGLFWRNEPLVVDARLRGRLQALFAATPRSSPTTWRSTRTRSSGTARSSQRASARANDGPFGSFGRDCSFDDPVPVAELTDRVRRAVEREPLVLRHGPDPIRRIAITTGGAGYDLVQAAHEGYDALLTGEPEEPNAAAARELGVHLIAAGHHATERLGVQALSAHLADRFGLACEYVEIDNPV